MMNEYNLTSKSKIPSTLRFKPNDHVYLVTSDMLSEAELLPRLEPATIVMGIETWPTREKKYVARVKDGYTVDDEIFFTPELPGGYPVLQ